MSNPQHEPTMEEILASIRKIISEDSTEEAPPEEHAEATVPEPAPASEPVPAAPVMSEPVPEADDILELTDEIPVEPAPQSEPAPAREPVADKTDDIVFESIEEEMAMPEPEMPAKAEASAEPSEAIFSDKTRQALDDAFAGLDEEADAALAAPAAAGPLPGVDGHSVEAVFQRAVQETFDPVLRSWLGEHTDAIIEGMKPVIREWMDQNFPPMLEEAVRGEVARVARSRRR